MHFTSKFGAVALGLLASISNANPVASPSQEEARDLGDLLNHNDFSCRSSSHPNPVVLLHGLGATYYEDLNFLEGYLKTKNYCTFSITYGAYDGFPLVGGLRSIDDSMVQIADFIKQVKQNTGASKVDIVGHSEGGFQSLYVTKYGGVSDFIGNVVAIAPPTHGTSFAGLYKLAQLLGIDNGVNDILKTFGCVACTEITTGGPLITKLNNGPITQSGVKYTIIASKYDELVTPTKTAFVNEPGVNNIYVQDYCPLDPVGHIGEAYDLNVWNLVTNSLSNNVGQKFLCLLGSPGK